MVFSVVIPVYNRPHEVDELLQSLNNQTYTEFEVILVEDGSNLPCKDIADQYFKSLNITYLYKKNTGPGDSRNVGAEKAKGEFIVFFDSDCIIPKDYFKIVHDYIQNNAVDCYGGPDAAHPSFSPVQKAINYTMTSFITTGGIRGKEKNLDQYQPRSFNMGIRKSIFQKLHGFSNIHPGEDPDLSYKIIDAGYNVKLISEAYVFHKRRIDFSKFSKQVYKFGLVRCILMKWHPKHTKIVYFFPSIFLFGSFLMLILSVFNTLFILPLIVFMVFILMDSYIQNSSLYISILSVPASFIQLYFYALGFIKGYFFIFILKSDEKKVFKKYFFQSNT